MAVSKSQLKATKKYNDKIYDSVLLRLPKGEKAFLKEYSKIIDLSLNEFIKWSIQSYFRFLKEDFPDEFKINI
jgi:hypothetical protein